MQGEVTTCSIHHPATTRDTRAWSHHGSGAETGHHGNGETEGRHGKGNGRGMDGRWIDGEGRAGPGQGGGGSGTFPFRADPPLGFFSAGTLYV